MLFHDHGCTTTTSELQYPRLLILLVLILLTSAIELENIIQIIQEQPTILLITSISIGAAILLSLLIFLILKKLSLSPYLLQYTFLSIFPLLGMAALLGISIHSLIIFHYGDHPPLVPLIGDVVICAVGLMVGFWMCCCIRCNVEGKEEEFGCICWPVCNIWKASSRNGGVKMDTEVASIHSKWVFVFLYLLMEMYFLYSNTVFLIRNWQQMDTKFSNSTKYYCTEDYYLFSLGLDIALVSLGGTGLLLAVLTVSFIIKGDGLDKRLDSDRFSFPRVVRFLNVFVAVVVVLLVLLDTVGDFVCELEGDKLYDYMYVLSAGANLFVVLILWLSFVNHHYEAMEEEVEEEESSATPLAKRQ